IHHPTHHDIYPLSLHDALPISINSSGVYSGGSGGGTGFLASAANSSGNFSTKLWVGQAHASPNAQIVRPAMLFAILVNVRGSSRSEEHTSELQSRSDLVCRLLL